MCLGETLCILSGVCPTALPPDAALAIRSKGNSAYKPGLIVQHVSLSLLDKDSNTTLRWLLNGSNTSTS